MELLTIPLNLPFVPVFIGGAPRSGTTLTYALMCTATNTNNYLRETGSLKWLFEFIIKSIGDDGEFISQYHGNIERFVNFSSTLLERTLMEYWENIDRPEVAIFKYPHFSPIFGTLSTLLPDAKFVTVTREPKYVISSQIKVLKRKHRKEYKLKKQNIIKLTKKFLNFYDHEECSNIKFVRYEDVISGNFLEFTEDFLDLNGMDYDKLGDSNWGGKSSNNEESRWMSQGYGSNVSDQFQAVDRLVIPVEFIEIIDRVSDSFRQRFNYA